MGQSGRAETTFPHYCASMGNPAFGQFVVNEMRPNEMCRAQGHAHVFRHARLQSRRLRWTRRTCRRVSVSIAVIRPNIKKPFAPVIPPKSR